jgi:D-xylose transport system ATP-binding protein
VFDLADRVTVMKNGQVVGAGRVEDMTKDKVLGMIILGKCPPGAVPGPGAMALGSWGAIGFVGWFRLIALKNSA